MFAIESKQRFPARRPLSRRARARRRRSPAIAMAVLTALLATGARADPGPLADPTAPSNRSAPVVVSAAHEYHLSGIWWRDGRGSAVINGARAVVGTVLEGARVVAVSPDQVRLRLADGTLTTLRNAPQVVRRAAAAEQNGALAARE